MLCLSRGQLFNICNTCYISRLGYAYGQSSYHQYNAGSYGARYDGAGADLYGGPHHQAASRAPEPARPPPPPKPEPVQKYCQYPLPGTVYSVLTCYRLSRLSFFKANK